MNDLELETQRVRSEVAAQLFGRSPAPVKIGRFLVEGRLGAGAMGVVYRAFDPTLGRHVAVKLVSLRILASGSDSANRLLGEARALASIAHPNIVPVFEAGALSDCVYIATELVDGLSVRAWLDGKTRSVAEVLEVFKSAGRGLFAVHEAGLIHRDFKPSNIMIGTDGRVRVIDFGLALVHSGVRDDSPVVGVGAGTPAYMAPEAHHGNVDARSDQFSFCVALYEALAGHRPFDGASLAELAQAIEAGPRDLKAPVFVAEVIKKGLSPDPDQRFRDMQALLSALDRDPQRVRRRVAAGTVAVVALFAAGAFVAGQWGRSRTWAERCEAGARASAARVWSSPKDAALRSAFAKSGHPAHASRADGAAAALSRYAAAVAEGRRTACRATHVDGQQSEKALDLRSRCLDRRTQAATALIDLMIDAPDRALVGAAISAVDRLQRPDDCADTAWLQGIQPLPADAPYADAVAEQRTALDRVLALRAIGRYQTAFKAAQPIVAAAEPIGFAPLTAEAMYIEADLLDRIGRSEKATERMRAAIRHAAVAGDPRLEAEGWTNLLWIVGFERNRQDEAAAVRLSAESAVLRAGQPADLVTNLDLTVARLEIDARDLAAAERRVTPYYEGAIAPDSRAKDRRRPVRLMALIRDEQGRYAEGIELHQRELEFAELQHGKGTLRSASALESIALNYRLLGHPEKALPVMRETLRLYVENLGPDNPRTAAPMSNVAVVLTDLRKFDEAKALAARALTLRRGEFGDNHPQVADQLNELAAILHKSGDFAAAEVRHREALAIREAKLGKDHFMVGVSSSNLAGTLQSLGKLNESLALGRRALAIFEQKFGPDHVNVSYPLLGIGAALLSASRAREAAASFERAISIREKAEMGKHLIAPARLDLARALWAMSERRRAITQAQAALAEAKSAGEAGQSTAEDAMVWLKTHN